MQNHKKVEIFNKQVLGIEPRDLGMMPKDEFKLSMAQLREEIEEIEEAYDEGNLVGVVDGLIDLDYFHKGIIYKHGINYAIYHMLFGQVHESNMTKKKGVKETRRGFGDAADAIKPQGWVAPETKIYETLKAVAYDHPDLSSIGIFPPAKD